MQIINDIMTEAKRLGIKDPLLKNCFENIAESKKLKAEDLAELTEYIPGFRADVGISQALLTESVQKGLINSDAFLMATLSMFRGMK